jgi:uncharacterized protein YbjT (DUF2867 family)
MTLVIGGTRGTGLLIARLLRSNGARVRVLARNPVEAARRLPSGVEVIGGDLTHAETLLPAVEGTHHIVLTRPVSAAAVFPPRHSSKRPSTTES